MPKLVGEECYRPNKQFDTATAHPMRFDGFPRSRRSGASLLLILGAVFTFYCAQLPEVIEDNFHVERNEVNVVPGSLRSLVFYHASLFPRR